MDYDTPQYCAWIPSIPTKLLFPPSRSKEIVYVQKILNLCTSIMKMLVVSTNQILVSTFTNTPSHDHEEITLNQVNNFHSIKGVDKKSKPFQI
jgi:hypothetical protein